MSDPNAGGNPDGDGKPWFGDLPADAAPDFKDWIANKNFSDPVTALTSAFNQEKLIGADRAGRTVVLPKDDKDLEGQKAFRAKMGVPETPDAYNLPSTEGQDPAFIKASAALFHGQGVPPASARAIFEGFNKHIGEMVKAEETAAQLESAKQMEAVKNEWGQNFDAHSEIARRFVTAAGLNQEQLGAVEEALGTATFLKTFHAMGRGLGEASFAGGDGGAPNASSRQAMDDLRQRRINGQIGEAEYHLEVERLHRPKAA
jgi:hypothetical protein